MENIQYTADTLVSLLASRAASDSGKIAFMFLEEGELESGKFTYAELDNRARSIGAELISLGLVGERALLVYESGPDYLDSFFGCLYSGVISVPLHPPGKNKSLSRISAIAKDSDAKVILSTKEIIEELKDEFAKDDVLKNIKWISTDSIPDQPSKYVQPGITPGTLAYLQYTSGSTGIPKGVMVNHRNLLHNINIIDKCHPHDEKSVMVTWLPIHHDMGLIYGILLPLVCGYPCYYMTPQAFVQRPFRWLNAISKYKGTHNAAPNFAFELCVNKITPEQKKNLDLSSWTVAMNAAEPVRAETMQKFAQYFGDCGFKLKYFAPGYGLAEGTLILSTTLKDQIPVMKRFDDNELEKNNKAVNAKEDDYDSKIHSGHYKSIEDTRIAIVNPNTKLECKEGEVGEVWASGISIAQGYWKREDATSETFRAHISDTNEGPFLRTGDLGFIKDNELYITGRHKDLIIIRGQNHYPQDIEYTVEASHPALRLGCVAAFSIDENGEEHLGIVQEVQKNFVNDFDAGEVFKNIVKAVSDEHDLQVSSITLIKPGTVPKTSSGKIQRRACQQGAAEGSLEVLAEWKHGNLSDVRKGKLKTQGFVPEADNLKQWLVSRLSNLLQIKEETIDPNEPFAVYGIDSLKAVQLSGDLEELLGKELPATLVYDYPTINLLSKFLSPEETDKSKSSSANADAEKDLSGSYDIAVIGIGLRFPGANSVDEFWNNLISGKSSIVKIPEGRWDKCKLKDSTITYGGFVDDVDKFDPLFFGISPREAIQIDPQQRFTLEVAWHALEDAGINPDSLAGTSTGVFLGICTYDYSRFSSGKKNLFDVYTGTGTSLSIAANRISYTLDLRGPSVAIDTACSSSLVALHSACTSIRSGESGIALAGGVNLLLSPDWNVVFTEADMLAPDGRCKTFDSDADGYVRSEGCGIVVLKKYSDAVRDGDRIYSVIKGSAINQDGKSNGLTAPNGPSQEDVIKSALKNSGVEANEITYLETHGTGTPLGDPIEVNSLTRVLSQKNRDEICYIGSVKTNIGHLEAAAGIAGVIKTSLALFNKEIPKHLNFKNLNSEISIEGKGIRVADENVKWNAKKRIAGVSSFGFGGTNAHVVLQEAPEVSFHKNKKTEGFNLLTLSAKAENSLSELSNDVADYISANGENSLNNICYSANTGRALFAHRLAVVAASKEELQTKLKAFADNRPGQNIFNAVVKSGHSPKIAFLFPGQGAQFIGMGKELYDNYSLFRNILNECDEILRNYLDKSLLEVLFFEKDENLNPINETTYTQPALFAIEYALAKLWLSWGVEPALMMGHSAGEYVAACLAGVFSLEDGLKLVAERGRLMQTMSDEGEMYTIFTDEKSVQKVISTFNGKVSIASINSPVKTVVSGDKKTLSKVIAEFDKANIEYRKINVSIASHSPLMNSMVNEFRKVCESIKYSEAAIPVVSNITGEIVTNEISNPEYWCRHILSPVRFSDSVLACTKSGVQFFIDMGPKPTSISMGQETVSDPKIHWLPSLKYNFTIREIMFAGLAELFVNGVSVNWKNFYDGNAFHKISLPGYPFQKTRYWIADEAEYFAADFAGDDESQNFAGVKFKSASVSEIIFNRYFSRSNPKYLEDHKVFGEIILPGAAYVEMSMAAISEVFGKTGVMLEDVRFHEALRLNSNKSVLMQTILTKSDKKAHADEIKIFSMNDDGNSWTLHFSCKLNDFKTEKGPNLESIKAKFSNRTDVSKFYERISETNVEYGKHFRGISELFAEKKSALSRLKLDSGIVTGIEHAAHPVLLDSAFQTTLALLLNDDNGKASIPVGIKQFVFSGKLASELWCYVKLKSGNEKDFVHESDLNIFNSNGILVASIKGLMLKEISREEFQSASGNIDDWFYEVKWIEQSGYGRIGISDIMQNAWKDFTDAGKKVNIEKHTRGISEIETLSVIIITNVLSELGVSFEKGKNYNREELIKNLSITEKQRKLFGRLLDILAESGILKKHKDSYEVIRNESESNRDIETGLHNIRKNFPQVNSELELLVQCGRKLPEILTGKAEPLEVLFPGGNATLVSDLYFKSPAFITMNNSIAEAVRLIAENNRKGVTVKILEIGAGTGSTAEPVLKILEGKNIKYTFTDISPSFFEHAKERFKGYDNIEYKTLNIEKSPLVQGFRANEFDIIIASNVMHATADLCAAMENAYRILKEDGMIILNEVTQKRNWIDLTFGITDGWWRFNDHQIREDYPLLSRDEWRKFLVEQGYVVSCVSESKGSNDTGQSIILIDKFKFYDEQIKKLIFFSEGFENNFHSDKANTVVVNSGKKFMKISENSFELNYSDREDFKKLFADISAKSGFGIFYFNGEANPPDDESEKRFLDNCEAILNLIKTVSRDDVKVDSFNIVTKNSQKVLTDDQVNGFSSSLLWGIGKVIQIEHPELNCSITDIDDINDPDEVMSSIDRIADTQTAIRGGKIFSARLSRKNITSDKDFAVDDRSTYIITGGFGGLGLLTAEFLISKGAKHIALLTRDTAKASNKKVVEELKKKGAEVKVFKADVSDYKSLKKIFAEISNSEFRLKGIFHAAGVLDDSVLLNQTREKFKKVLTPKVVGTLNLHKLSEKLKLDFFVMYSSVASILGSAGQSNHSAANSFEDSLSNYRRSLGLPSLSINWGVWTGLGSAAERGADKKEKITGIGNINARRGIQSLDKALKLDTAQVSIFPMDWQKYSERFGSSFTNDLLEKKSPETDKFADTEKDDFIGRLKSADQSEHKPILISYFQDLISGIMGLEPEDFEVDQPLNTMGLDSLMAIELKNKVNTELGVDLNLVRYMEDTSILDLVEELSGQIPKMLSNIKASAPDVATKSSEEEKARELLAGLENLSDEELDKLLKEST